MKLDLRNLVPVGEVVEDLEGVGTDPTSLCVRQGLPDSPATPFFCRWIRWDGLCAHLKPVFGKIPIGDRYAPFSS